ncbi:MAG: molybdopterin-guanine dinucleotide biosynthesis protein MobB [Candidatus Eisenbacteria bacterium]|nr:molybdopterin-guanine dinucleotide biosynthesis protein MobB [Candidatus Eisenbacteria bacterium]
MIESPASPFPPLDHAPSPLLVALAGYSKSGKTSLAERLTPRLAARGLRVGYLKANAHRIDLDEEGKDTARLRHAGATPTAIHAGPHALHFPGEVLPALPGHVDPSRVAPELRPEEEAAMDHVIRARFWNLRPLFAGSDIVLVEGLKASALPKLVVNRAGHARGELDPAALRGVLDTIRFDPFPDRPIGEVLQIADPAWTPWLDRAERAVERAWSAPERVGTRGLIGAVIAGGGSKRMGCDKAALALPAWPDAHPDFPQPGTWLERAFLLLAERLREVWVVGRICAASGSLLPNLVHPVPSHLDLEREVGPLAGLLTALSVAGERGVLILPCDLPLLSPTAIESLLAGRGNGPERPAAGATAFRHPDGRCEPMVAVIEASAREPLAAYLRAGGRRFEQFLEEIGVHWISVPADLSSGFRNLNRPEDLP